MKSQKITEREPRTYDDACGMAHALDLVGERWALLVMRELFYGPRRFGDLRVALPGISANVLTQRLAGLEVSGIVARRRLPPPAGSQVYDLTDWGRESEPIFQALGRWAARSPSHDPTKPISATSVLLSLRTMFAPSRAKDFAATIALRFGEETFSVRIADGRIDVEPGTIDSAEVSFTGEPRVLAAAIYGGQPIEGLEAAGALQIAGSRRIARKFLTLFPLPEKAVV